MNEQKPIRTLELRKFSEIKLSDLKYFSDMEVDGDEGVVLLAKRR